MTPDEHHKCAHPPCLCIVEHGKKYCSQRCQDAGDEIEISCDCAHDGCALS